MRSYISSNNISVFPQANRSTSIQPTASLLTEDAIAGIVRRASDDSYVIEQDFDSTSGSEKQIVEFVLGGYYFKVDFYSSGIDISNKYVKVSLFIDTSSGSSDHIMTADVVENSTSRYKGIWFDLDSSQSGSWKGHESTTQSGTNGLLYYMYILDSNSEIPEQVRKSLDVISIDCGTLP